MKIIWSHDRGGFLSGYPIPRKKSGSRRSKIPNPGINIPEILHKSREFYENPGDKKSRSRIPGIRIWDSGSQKTPSWRQLWSQETTIIFWTNFVYVLFFHNRYFHQDLLKKNLENFTFLSSFLTRLASIGFRKRVLKFIVW